MKNLFLFFSSLVFFETLMPGCKREILVDKSVADRNNAENNAKSVQPGLKEQLVTGLEELQGSTVGPDKALYVTAPLAGTIWRVDPKTGAVTPFTTGLPKRIPGLYYLGSGVVDVAFRGGTAYALVTGVAPDLDGHDIVGIYRVDGPDSYTIMADIGAWSIAHPPVPAFFVPTGFQYAMEPYRDGFIVTDGHHNRVLYVTLNGEITEVIAFADVVPTGLAVRGNTIYVTQAGPIPHLPENSKLMSLSLKSPAATEVASAAGLNVGLFVDVEFGRGNTLYTLAQGNWDGPFEGAPALPNTGALLKLNPDGTFSVITDGLNQPTSVEFIGNNAYVVSLAGEIWEIDNVSQPPYGH
jgi:sugar lactone lactonase YvrE